MKTFSIGQIIRDEREAKKLSLDGLARITGLTKDHIGRIERVDHSNPTIETLSKIASALGIKITDLLKEAA